MGYLVNKPVHEIKEDDDIYFLQNGFTGNSLCFWKINGCGYTSNINEAQQFTKAEALSQNKTRKDDKPWNAYQVVQHSNLTCSSERIPVKHRITK